MERREFNQGILKLAAALLLERALGPGLLRPRMSRAGTPADASQERFLVVWRVSGGMDCVAGLDPKTHADHGTDESQLFIPYRPDQIVEDRTGRIRLAPPAAPLLPYAERLAVIRGIVMGEAEAHDSSLDYMASGHPSQGKACFSAELAATAGAGPLGVVGDLGDPTREFLASLFITRFRAGQRSVPITFASALRGIAGQIAKGADDTYAELLARLPGRSGPLARVLQAIVDGEARLKRFPSILQALEKEHGPLDIRHLVAGSFAAGAARQAEIYTWGFGAKESGDLTERPIDSHMDYEAIHPKSQRELVWDQVAGLMKILDSIPYGQGRLSDHTVVWVLTEYSRTPYLNTHPKPGKDHNPLVNACAILGPGIKPGVYGASSVILGAPDAEGPSIHMGTPFDFAAGRPVLSREAVDERWPFIAPENVAATVLKLFGEPTGFSTLPAGSQAIPGLVAG